MLYYSKITKKFYDTADECEKAELDATKLKEKKEMQTKIDKNMITEKIKSLDEDLEKAYDNYRAAKDEATKILEESNEKVKTILQNAQKEVKAAQTAKYNAIKEYNDKYGVYQVSYSGNDALREFKRMFNFGNSIFDYLF